MQSFLYLRIDIKANRLFSRQTNILSGRVTDMTCYLGISRRLEKRITFVGVIRHWLLLARNTLINLVLLALPFVKTICLSNI